VESLPGQRCANCSHALDTRIYVRGTRLPCPGCGLTVTVERSDVSQLRAARPVSGGAAPVEPPPPTPPSPSSQPTLDDSETLVRHAVAIPGYELEVIIGRGGMGEVWRAKQVSLGREVAVKVLAANLAREADFVKRFEKEAAALAALSHPGIVQIIDRGVADGVPYFVMEFVHGHSLRDLVDAKNLAPAEALKIVVQVAAAIESAHVRGVIHRDVKPENILIDTEGRVKVADFGLAGIRGDKFNVTATAMTMGTLNYMAPEQRKDAKAVDARADIYSLGVVLYELLTGDVPVGHFRLPSERVPGLDKRIDAVVLKALASDRTERFPSAAAMAQALEGMLSTISLHASSLPDAPAIASRPPEGAADGLLGPRTRPDAPAALPTHAPERSPSTVITHVRKAGNTLRALVVGVALVVGALAIATVITGRPLLHVDDAGLTVLGFNVTRTVAHPTLLPPEPMPTDRHSDLGIALTATQTGPDLVVESALGAGNSGSLIAWDGEWSATDQGLIAREFDRFASEGERPRATLEAIAYHLSDLSVLVQVQLDPTPPRGYVPKEPRASIFFRSDHLLLELSMRLGDAPVYRLVVKYTDASGLQEHASGDVEFNRVAPPPPGKSVSLRLVSRNGQVAVLADGVPVLSSPMRLPASMLSHLGRVGLSCEEATCRFTRLHLEGSSGHEPSLAEDDVHEHVVKATTPVGP
jgi:serine/threonine protein kinase